MTEQQWVITVDDQHIDRLDEVVDALRSAGLRVDRILRTLGQVTGFTESAPSAAAETRQRLAAVPGVESCAPGKHYRVNPSDSDDH